ncbi:hypothetical protein SUGI_0457680 [Cryptomeria japonica]|nr:hypothetical protein SUGI_0457680 [Cryptomeria japonica]
MSQISYSSILYTVSFSPANFSFKCPFPSKSPIFHCRELTDSLPPYPLGCRINLKGPVPLRAQLNDINSKRIIPIAHVSDTHYTETHDQFTKTYCAETKIHFSNFQYTKTNAQISDTHYSETNAQTADSHLTDIHHFQTNAHLTGTHDRGVGYADMDTNASPHDQELLSSIIDIAKNLPLLGEEGLVSQAVHLLEWMGFQEPSIVSPESYSLVFPLLGRAGMVENLWLVFENMPGGREFHCANIYNAAISGFAQCSRYDDAWKVFEEMDIRNIGPDTVTYSSLITIMRKSGQSAKDVWQFFERISKNGVNMSSEIFGSLIKSFCDECLMREALIVLFEMENKKGRYGVVEELIQEMEHLGLKPDVWTFTSLISSYGRQKKMSDKAADAFLRMRKQGVQEILKS